MAPANLPRLATIGIDGPALLFTLAVALLAGATCGLIPVLKFARASLSGALREGGRTLSGGKARYRARNLLAVTQIALALVLLVGAGLMIRTFQALRHVNPGFQTSDVLTFRLPLQISKTVTPEVAARIHQRVLERIRQIPGVSSAAGIDHMLMGVGDHNPILVEEFPAPGGQLGNLRTYKFITPGLFATLGVPLLAGRDLDWSDILVRQPRVAVVSENFALQYWKTPAAALGKRIRNAPAAAWREIVGVVGNEHEDGLDKPEPQMVYFPLMVDHLWSDEPMTRTSVDYAVLSPRTGTPALLDEIRHAVKEVNPSVPITNVRSMQKVLDRSVARTSFTLVMLGIAGAMALLLGIVGIYGVIAYSVSQRTREIGIRMALGAEQRSVRSMFVRDGFVLTGAGLLLGLAGSVAVTRWMAALLYGVTPTDPITYAAVALVLTAATALASYLPSRRATAIDPVETLRAE